jgi:beta-fructofuranosidase
MIHLRNFICLAAVALYAAAALCQHESQRALQLPRIAGKYTTIYCPAADRFPGPDTSELKAGRRYAVWVPNDHTFIKGPDGRWNLFGITHPLTSPTPKTIHEGEFQSFHALAPAGELKEVLATGAWKDLPKVLRASDRPGENPAFYAPDVIQRGALYYMFYGPDPIRLATSPDLQSWTPLGPLFSDEPSARDPSVLFWQGVYSMVYCVENTLALRTSTDLRRWSSPRTILRMTGNMAPESPTIVRHDGKFYLFVCIWNGLWDGKTVQGAYSHQTYIYQSDNILDFAGGKPVTILDSHAPEVFQGEDGQWYISSAEWPRRGVSIAKLSWE